MSQQFDMLNTGNTGVADTFGNEEMPKAVDEAIQQQRQEALEMLPSIKAVLATLDDEIAAVSDIRAYRDMLKATAKLTELERNRKLSREMDVRDMYIEMIERLKLNIGNRVADYENTNE